MIGPLDIVLLAFPALMQPVVEHCHTFESGASFCDPARPRHQIDPVERGAYISQYAAALAKQKDACNSLTPAQFSRLKPEWQVRCKDLNDGK